MDAACSRHPLLRRYLYAPSLAVLVLAACDERPMPTAVPPQRASLDAVPGQCIVTSTADVGVGSLREAINHPDCTQITFSLPLPATIALTSGQLFIFRSLSIVGPGADQLTIARSSVPGTPNFRIFEISPVTVEISGLTISNGNAGLDFGGGIYSAGSTLLDGVAVVGNRARSVGGIANVSSMTITNSSISGNVSILNGGGIENKGSMFIQNTTVSGNRAAIGGGGINNEGTSEPASLVIIHSTITANTLTDFRALGGGGLLSLGNTGTTTTILNSIIAGNIAPTSLDVFRGAGSIGATYTLIGSPSGHSLTATPENGNLIGTVATPLDPRLGPLTLNAPGTTATHALLEDSPAIGIGVCTDHEGKPVTTDQRGSSRPQPTGTACDMGAYELDQTPPDNTPPVITPTITGTLGTNGWYRSDVTVTWSVVDDESTVTSVPSAPTTITADTPGQAVSCDATSTGGSSSQSVTIKRDATAPTLAPSVSPNPVLLNGTATATPNANDAMAGVASSSCATPNTASVGAKSVSCTATDNAGNTASASASYSVRYQFIGFVSPIDGGGVLNSAKAGQIIPLKWRLLDANDAPVTTLTTATVTVASLACTAGASSDELEEYAAGISGLQNLGDGYYQFNWATPKNYAGSCKTMQLALGDGITRDAVFAFRK